MYYFKGQAVAPTKLVIPEEDIAALNIAQMQTVDLVETLLSGLYVVASDQTYADAEEYFQTLASAILGVENE